jgi:hypothetical protein
MLFLQYLEDLRDALQNGRDVLAPRAAPVMITNFSSGYNGNGLAGRLKYDGEAVVKPRKRAPKADKAIEEVSQAVVKPRKRAPKAIEEVPKKPRKM